MEEVLDEQNITLLDLLDRVIDKGVVIQGDLRISVADVDLLYVSLKLLVTSVSQLRLGTDNTKDGFSVNGTPNDILP